jgi:hypothetical protein
LQIADLLAWSIRADREGLPSPVLNVIRNADTIGGAYERKWNPSGLANFVIDIEERLKAAGNG